MNGCLQSSAALSCHHSLTGGPAAISPAQSCDGLPSPILVHCNISYGGRIARRVWVPSPFVGVSSLDLGCAGQVQPLFSRLLRQGLSLNNESAFARGWHAKQPKKCTPNQLSRQANKKGASYVSPAATQRGSVVRVKFLSLLLDRQGK